MQKIFFFFPSNKNHVFFSFIGSCSVEKIYLKHVLLLLFRSMMAAMPLFSYSYKSLAISTFFSGKLIYLNTFISKWFQVIRATITGWILVPSVASFCINSFFWNWIHTFSWRNSIRKNLHLLYSFWYLGHASTLVFVYK